MKFEFICDNGVFYTPVNNFLKFIMGKYSLQVRADFATRFQKTPLRTFDNIGTNGRLFVRVDVLINQTMASYEMSEYERFNEFVVFCKKHILEKEIKDETPKDFFYDHSGLLSRVDRDLNKLYKRVMDIEKFITEIDFKNIISYDKEKKIKIKNLENQIKAITEHLGGKYENGAILLCKEKLEQKETKKRFFSNFF